MHTLVSGTSWRSTVAAREPTNQFSGDFRISHGVVIGVKMCITDIYCMRNVLARGHLPSNYGTTFCLIDQPISPAHVTPVFIV